MPNLLPKTKIPAILVIFFAVLGQIPLVLLLSSPPQNFTSIGGSPLLSPLDNNVYFSAIKQGQLGQLLYTNSFTTIDNSKIMIHSLYIIIGRLTNLLHIPPSAIFILAQFIASIILLSSIWLLCSNIFTKRKHKLLYFCVVLFVTGYGWLILLLANKIPALYFVKNICSGRCFSIDLWTADATVFPLLSTVPHITLTAATIILIVLAMNKYLKRQDKKSSLLLILLTTLIGLLSAYHLLLILSFYLLILLSNLRRLKSLKALIAAIVILLLRGIYLAYALYSHASFANWMKNSNVSSPPFPSFIIGWLGLLLPAYFGLRYLPKTPLTNLVKKLLILSLALSLLPSAIARNFVLTIPVFLAIFATFGLISLPKNKILSKIIWAVVVLATIDTFIIYIPALSVKNQLAKDPSQNFFFISDSEKEGLWWLSKNSRAEEGVLTSYRLGSIIPAYVGNKVFFGHWSQSGHSSNLYKYDWVIEGKNENEVLKFLVDNHLNWIIAPSDNLPKNRTYLKLSFANSALSIYKVSD